MAKSEVVDLRFELNALTPKITDRRVRNGELKSPYHKWHEDWSEPPSEYTPEFATIVDHIQPMLNPHQNWQLEGICRLPAERPPGNEIAVEFLLGYYSRKAPKTFGFWPPQVQLDFDRIFTPQAQTHYTRGNNHEIIRRLESKAIKIPGFLTDEELTTGEIPTNALPWSVTHIDFAPFDFTDYRGWTIGEDPNRFTVSISLLNAVFRLSTLSEWAASGHFSEKSTLEYNIDRLKTLISQRRAQLTQTEEKLTLLQEQYSNLTTSNIEKATQLKNLIPQFASLHRPSIKISSQT